MMRGRASAKNTFINIHLPIFPSFIMAMAINISRTKCVVLAIAVSVFFLLSYFGLERKFGSFGLHRSNIRPVSTEGVVPPELLKLGVYNESIDFKNEAGIETPFWGCNHGSCNKNSRVWGPCYAPNGRVDWSAEVDFYEENKPSYRAGKTARPDQSDLSNLCRPGFLIIGAGKCGTSSLYHYITDHPRVLPAKEKQIHYFKYYTQYPMQWYLRHFPTAKSFLASGALMTGEASPGYLPYPDVAHLVRARLPGPRIIAVGREPIDRAYSSYRYNYLNPTLQLMKEGKIHGIEKGLSDEKYLEYVFSFEDMVRAELQVLRECLDPDTGSAVLGARNAWGDKPWARKEFKRREEEGEPPLVDLDGYCYGSMVNSSVLRRQWIELTAKYPKKVIPNRNLHLTQSFIGRGLYTLPLEWWYAIFPRSDIFFMCTEELSDSSGNPLSELGQFLGLPAFNFSETVLQGAYNVGGHKGYDKEISWETIQEEAKEVKENIPLSDDLRSELSAFLRPLNERLFALTGKRCNW